MELFAKHRNQIFFYIFYIFYIFIRRIKGYKFYLYRYIKDDVSFIRLTNLIKVKGDLTGAGVITPIVGIK
jgi:hypothetical protein